MSEAVPHLPHTTEYPGAHARGGSDRTATRSLQQRQS